MWWNSNRLRLALVPTQICAPAHSVKDVECRSRAQFVRTMASQRLHYFLFLLSSP